MVYLVITRMYWAWAEKTGRWSPPDFLKDAKATDATSCDKLRPLFK